MLAVAGGRRAGRGYVFCRLLGVARRSRRLCACCVTRWLIAGAFVASAAASCVMMSADPSAGMVAMRDGVGLGPVWCRRSNHPPSGRSPWCCTVGFAGSCVVGVLGVSEMRASVHLRHLACGCGGLSMHVHACLQSMHDCLAPCMRCGIGINSCEWWYASELSQSFAAWVASSSLILAYRLLLHAGWGALGVRAGWGIAVDCFGVGDGLSCGSAVVGAAWVGAGCVVVGAWGLGA